MIYNLHTSKKLDLKRFSEHGHAWGIAEGGSVWERDVFLAEVGEGFLFCIHPFLQVHTFVFEHRYFILISHHVAFSSIPDAYSRNM
jgi:hypothetical protein